MDKRNEILAHNLINYSVRLKKGEKLLIELIDEGMELAQALIREAYKVGGIPFLTIKNLRMQRELLLGATKEQMEFCAEYETLRMKGMDAYIAIRGSENVSQLSDVPAQNMELYSKYWMKPVHSDIRVLCGGKLRSFFIADGGVVVSSCHHHPVSSFRKLFLKGKGNLKIDFIFRDAGIRPLGSGCRFCLGLGRTGSHRFLGAHIYPGSLMAGINDNGKAAFAGGRGGSVGGSPVYAGGGVLIFAVFTAASGIFARCGRSDHGLPLFAFIGRGGRCSGY